jgi:hypothetical protein
MLSGAGRQDQRGASRARSTRPPAPRPGIRSASEKQKHAAACDAISRAGMRDGAASPRRAAACAAVRYARTLRCCCFSVATTVIIFSTKRAPSSLCVPKLPLRHRPPGRSDLSAAFFVGATPSTGTKVPNTPRRFRISRPVPSVFGTPQRLPTVHNRSTSRRSGVMEERKGARCQGALAPPRPPRQPLGCLRPQGVPPLLCAAPPAAPRCKGSQPMRPAHLPPPPRGPGGGTRALRPQDARAWLTPPCARHLAPTGPPPQQHRHAARHRPPPPGALVTLAPAGRSAVGHGLPMDVSAGCLHGRGDPRGRGRLRLAERAHPHGHPAQGVPPRPRRALGQALGPGTQRHRGVDVGPRGATGHASRPGHARRLATRRAGPLRPLLRGEHRLAGRHLPDLRPQRRGLVSR